MDLLRPVWIKKESGSWCKADLMRILNPYCTCLESVSKTMSKVNDFGGSWGGAWGFVTATVPVTGFTEVTLWNPLSTSSLLSGRIRITTRTFSTSSSKDLLWDLLLFYKICIMYRTSKNLNKLFEWQVNPTTKVSRHQNIQ